jgi:hypothetical protein
VPHRRGRGRGPLCRGRRPVRSGSVLPRSAPGPLPLPLRRWRVQSCCRPPQRAPLPRPLGAPITPPTPPRPPPTPPQAWSRTPCCPSPCQPSSRQATTRRRPRCAAAAASPHPWWAAQPLARITAPHVSPAAEPCRRGGHELAQQLGRPGAAVHAGGGAMLQRFNVRRPPFPAHAPAPAPTPPPQCFKVPLVRQLWHWIGTRPVSRSQILQELAAGRSVVLCPGGVQASCWPLAELLAAGGPPVLPSCSAWLHLLSHAAGSCPPLVLHSTARFPSRPPARPPARCSPTDHPPTSGPPPLPPSHTHTHRSACTWLPAGRWPSSGSAPAL